MTVPDSSYGSNEDEDTPLLSSTPEIPNSSQSPETSPRPSHQHRRTSSYIPHIHQTHSPRTITIILVTVLFILEFGGYLMAVPGIRIMEDIICHKQLGIQGDIDESLCKGQEVQSELSIISAGLHVIGAIPSLVTTIPYGLVADRIGRKPVFILGLVGIVSNALWQLTVMWFWRTIPLRLVWFGPIFTLIGGGERVAAMVFYAIICDITPEANRANIFLLGASVGLVGELIAPSIAAWLMKSSSWTSSILGLITLTIGTLLIFFIPETLHMRPRPSNPSHLTPSPSNFNLPTDTNTKKPSSLIKSIKSEFAKSLTTLRSASKPLSSKPLILLLLTFTIHPFTRQSVDLSLRYISTRFHFPLRLSSLILSLRAAINILLLLLILPALSYFLTNHFSFTTLQKDLYLARLSSLLLTLGILIIASSPTLPLTIVGMTIFTLGTGYISLTRSLVTGLVGREGIAGLLAAVAVVETIGALVAGPALARLYILGLGKGGAWVGLPFFGVGVVCAIGVGCVLGAGCVLGGSWDGKGEGVSREEERGDGEGAVLLGRERAREIEVDVGEVGAVNIV